MNETQQPSPAPDVGLQSLVRKQSWAWLVAISRRMHLSAEIVDADGRLCSPVVTGPATPVIRRQLSEEESPLLQAVGRAVETGDIESLSVKRLQVACCPISAGARIAGALILARDPFRAKAGERDPEDVASIGAWLAPAVEAHLLTEEQERDEPGSRFNSLLDVLYAAAERGADRDVVLAFSEALALGNQIEVRGYVEDVRGRFVLSVESRSGSPSAPPEVLDLASVPHGADLTRLPADAAIDLGFRRDRDVLVAMLRVPQPWFIALSGHVGAREESFLSAALGLLRHAMASAGHLSEIRLVRAIADHLLRAGEGAEASAALEELARDFDALGAALVVTAAHGMQLLSVGDTEVFAVPRPPGALDQLVVTLRVGDEIALLAVRRPEGETFTRYERARLDYVSGLFAAWLPSVLRRTPSARDRRATNREFEDVIERTAARSLDEGADVSALVIAVEAAPLRPGFLHRWAADLRSHLRASDVAGTLSDHEIGVLLPGTGPVGAVAVSARIQERLHTDEDEGLAAIIGFASRAPGVPPAGSIVQSARDDAATSRPGKS